MNKNITLSVDEALIVQALHLAAANGRTLDEIFNEWLTHYVSNSAAASRYDQIMARLEHINSGGKFTRAEMHEDA